MIPAAVQSIRNLITGEWVEVNALIHPDDVEWLMRTWNEVFELDFEIRRAESQTGGTRIWESAP